ncbi:MAG: lysophospholipid acyltransferase family protein [Bacteroidia bacterium]
MKFSSIQHQTDWELLEKMIPFAEVLKQYHRYKAYHIQRIPQDGRALILVNHSLATYDILLLGYAIFSKLNRLPRGLADRNFYKNTKTAEWMQKLGVYEANHQNAQQVLENDELLLLAPGGTREAIRSSKEKYQILWDDRMGFAKLSIKTQTPVILAASPNSDNLYEVKESPITKLVYKWFKFPLPIAKGLGDTIIPRPIKLAHYIHEPIYPPFWDKNEPLDEQMVKNFHDQVQTEMEEWMKRARVAFEEKANEKTN